MARQHGVVHQQKWPNLARPGQRSIGSQGLLDLASARFAWLGNTLSGERSNIWPATRHPGQIAIAVHAWPALARSSECCSIRQDLWLARSRKSWLALHFLARSHQISSGSPLLLLVLQHNHIIICSNSNWVQGEVQG